MNDKIDKFIDSILALMPDLEGYSTIIYTALFGAYDDLKDPVSRDTKALYLCFTDNPALRSDTWTIVVLDKNLLDPRMSARTLKMLPHRFMPTTDYSMWVDAKCLITKNTAPLLKEMVNSGCHFACFPHSVRSKVRSEAIACIVRGYDSVWKIARQWFSYKMNGFNDDAQLIESTVLVRQHTSSDVVIFQDQWFREILTRSIRDQLSFNYIAWRKNFSYHLFSVTLSEYFDVRPHARIGRYISDSRLRVPIQRKIANYFKNKK